MPASDRIDELKKRYDENPRRFFASLANEYRKAGDLDQAISLCQTHLAEQPSNMNGHVVYGQALFEAGRYDDAKETFEAALALDPENLIALRHLGDIACTNGANDKAREWYTRVLDADPRNDEILALLANLEEESKKTGDAAHDSAQAREAATVEFTPPQVITPLSNASVTPANPTPIVAIDTVETPAIARPVTPVSPSPRQSIGLMDLSIDFDTPTETSFAAESLVAPAAPEAPLGDFVIDPFVDTGAGDMLSWEPPAIEFDPPAFEQVELSALTAPIVQPQDEPRPEPVAPVAPLAASDDVDMLFGDTLPAEPAAPFVTETMAELYLQQGFRTEALEVYRQLSAQSPDDPRLKERVRALETDARASVSHGVIPEQQLGEVEGAVPVGAMFDFDATPVAPHAPIEPPEPEPEPVVNAAPKTARAYFAALSARRAVQSPRARPAPRTSAPRVSAPRISVPAAVIPEVPAPIIPASSVTSLDQLFGGGPIAPEDENVALAFAQVAGAVEMGSASVKGKPTAPAESALSLDSVFHEADARVTGTVPRQSQTLRFDQFFSTTGDEPEPPPAPRLSAPTGEPGSPAELQQFQSWLTQLKKP